MASRACHSSRPSPSGTPFVQDDYELLGCHRVAVPVCTLDLGNEVINSQGRVHLMGGTEPKCTRKWDQRAGPTPALAYNQSKHLGLLLERSGHRPIPRGGEDRRSIFIFTLPE